MPDESLRPQSQSTTGNKQVAQELEDEVGSHRKRRRGRPRTVERDENDVPLYLQRKKKKSVKQVPDGPSMPPDPETSPPTLQEILDGQPCMVEYEQILDFWVDEPHWTELDEKILEQSAKNNTSECPLWQIMWQVFGAPVTDLFRLGLVIDATGAIRTMTISDDLGAGVPPVWEDRIDVFRYVLMWSVCCRIEDHNEPLEPIQPLDGLVANRSLSKAAAASIAYKNTKRLGIRSEPVIDSLCQKRKSLVKPRPATSEDERQLFMLGSLDIFNVIEALDSLTIRHTNAKRWTETTSGFYNQWNEAQPQKDSRWPKGKDDVFFLKKASVQRARMESAFRDLLEGTGSYLYDISGANTHATATCFDNIEADGQDGPTQSQLNVVRGLVTPPFGAHLPASQWRMNKVGSSTNTPTNPHSPISRSRASSVARSERRLSVNDEGSTLPGTSFISRSELDSINSDQRPLHQEDRREVTPFLSPPPQSSAIQDESVGSVRQRQPRDRKATVIISSEFDQFLKSEDDSSV